MNSEYWDGLRAARLREAANPGGASRVGRQPLAYLVIQLRTLRAGFFRLRNSRLNENVAAVPADVSAAVCGATVVIVAAPVRASVFFPLREGLHGLAVSHHAVFRLPVPERRIGRNSHPLYVPTVRRASGKKGSQRVDGRLTHSSNQASRFE